MRDPRLNTLANNLVNYSVSAKPGEKVLIELIGTDTEIVKALVEQVYQAGGIPIVQMTNQGIIRSLLQNGNDDQLNAWATYDAYRMKDMDCYIGIRAGDNITELSDVPDERMKQYMALYNKPVHSEIRLHTKWVVLRYPNASMAQSAGMSTEAFEDFYFNVCNLDYAKMSEAMDSLKALMERTDKVRIVGPGKTDLSFSIENIPVIKCDGRYNIPDGEVFTAPVRDSVNGVIAYNTPSIYNGFTYENITFEFENGKIIKATANNTERLNKLLDSDEGARYIGEFSIGFNPFIQTPMKDTLFDEKIDGSLHFTPGRAYDDADNGNRSSIHWDLVLIQRPQYGGGEIWFDDRLIRKDGRFVVPELENLNPENLK
jgi:aminopeptidase